MPDQNGMCLGEWEAAKKQFETRTNQKKPSPKFAGFRRGTNLASTLKKMDELYKSSSKVKDAKEELKLWQSYAKLLDDFAKERRSYKEVLAKAASGEQEATALDKEIEVLSKTLSAIESGARVNSITKLQLAEKNLKGATALDKEARQRELLVDTARRLAPTLDSSIKNGALFIAQVKAKPTPEVFNKEIQSAARKISQNIANIPKIFAATGDTLGVDVKRAETIGDILNAWGSGKRKLSPTADQKLVLRELGAYTQMLDACKLLLKQMQAVRK